MKLQRLLEELWQDLRYSLRLSLSNPRFTIPAVAILALGIGANTAVFSVINGILLRPIPVPNPETLVSLESTTEGSPPQGRFSYPNYQDLQKQNPVFSDLIALSGAGSPVLFSGSGHSEQLLAEVVSGNYFSVLGLNATRGRFFSSEDERTGTERVAVVSDSLWKRRFNGDPGLVGKALDLNGTTFTVVGISPPGYSGLTAGIGVDVWVPLRQAASWLDPDLFTSRDAVRVRIIGRLRPRVSLAQAQAAMTTRAKLLELTFPDANRGKGIRLHQTTYLDNSLRAPITAFLTVVLGLVVLVLLTACANLTNLLLVRAVGRRREMAVRQALGASRSRLARQVLTESVLLALGGGAAGILVGSWSSNLINHFNPLPATIPIRFDLSLDFRVLAVGASASLLAGILLGLAPSTNVSRANLTLALREGPGNLGGQNSRLRNFFVISQVAVSVVLLIGAGLFLRSLEKARLIPIGFDARKVFALDVDVKLKGFSDERGIEFYREMLQRVERLSEVRSATLSSLTPLDVATPYTYVLISGHEPLQGNAGIRISFNRVGPAYFETMAIPLKSGRSFTVRDDAARSQVVVINETMARKYWPGENAIGKHFHVLRNKGIAIPYEVIAVAADVKYRSLGEEPTPHLYLPFFQDYSSAMTLLVRTASDPGTTIASVQRELQNQDRAVQGFFARTLTQQFELALLPARLAAGVSAIFGGTALLLAILGIYGVVSFTARQRTREIGLRMALGAQPIDVLRLVLTHAERLVLVGVGAGLAVAFALSRFLASLLYGISGWDPLTFTGVALGLSAVALISCYLPARQATHVDPMVALRYE